MISGLEYTAKEIAEIVSGELVGENVKISALTLDTREEFTEKTCFFAIKGEKHNGADYINEAVKKGAILVVTQEKSDADVSTVYVKDTVKALGLLAKKHKGKTRIIGVTGSAGKTTVKDMIASVLSTKYSVFSTYKNSNNEIGVPLTLLNLRGEDFCVVEMGMRGKGQIEYLASISEPEAAVITNCGCAHIGMLGSKKNIFLAKSEILRYTIELAVLPSERRFKRMKIKTRTRSFVGKNGDAYPTNIRLEKEKMIFDVDNLKGVKINTMLKHNAYNACFAYIIGRFYGLCSEEIKEGLAKYEAEQGRGKIVRIGGLEVIDDTYNASYESMCEAIESLKLYCEGCGKRMAVALGDMREQGDKSLALHKKIGRLCKKSGVEKMFALGDFSNSYLKGFGGGVRLETLFELRNAVLKQINSEYVLLVKASRKMGFEKIIEWMKEENVKH